MKRPVTPAVDGLHGSVRAVAAGGLPDGGDSERVQTLVKIKLI
jgi:hypothetical protein